MLRWLLLPGEWCMWEGPDGSTILGHIRKGEHPSVELILVQLRGLSSGIASTPLVLFSLLSNNENRH
jgi:hypothetical protein